MSKPVTAIVSPILKPEWSATKVYATYYYSIIQQNRYEKDNGKIQQRSAELFCRNEQFRREASRDHESWVLEAHPWEGPLISGEAHSLASRPPDARHDPVIKVLCFPKLLSGACVYRDELQICFQGYSCDQG